MSTKISWLFLLVTFYVFTESEGHSKEDTNVMGGLLQDHLRGSKRSKRSLKWNGEIICSVQGNINALTKCKKNPEKISMKCRLKDEVTVRCNRVGSHWVCPTPSPPIGQSKIDCCDLFCSI
ncbi:uncharacterized protein [Clytia hemisphaerica]|uniref:Cnidarian restricted protein n=1 Tax=Clytia hemisphaerica TaxID=252671 RepID=A0A7M5USM1_9CNID